MGGVEPGLARVVAAPEFSSVCLVDQFFQRVALNEAYLCVNNRHVYIYLYIFRKKGRTRPYRVGFEAFVRRLVLCRLKKGEMICKLYAVPILNILIYSSTFIIPSQEGQHELFHRPRTFWLLILLCFC